MSALGQLFRRSKSRCFREIVLLICLLVANSALATAPTISGFSPASGVIGSTATISGTNFSTTSDTVKFNGTQATVSSKTTTQLVVTVPSGATTGTITVTVGTQTATSSTNFTVLPAITSFSPTGGASGASVTIHGTGFSATAAQDVVKFSGVSATVTAATTTQLTATVPSGILTGAITVTVGGNTATSSTNFVITPVVSSFSPTSGPVGTVVTITGTHFDPTAANDTLKFHGTAATVTSASTTQLVAAVPAGATSGTVSVTVGGQTGTSSGSFTVTVPPTITSFSPGSGTPNTSVTITGTNFSSTKANDLVYFNGAAATVSSATSTQLVAKVPSTATTGPISVTVTSTGLSATSASNFTVPVPTITQFTPSGGMVGTTVTITGTNFDPTPGNNQVNFHNINGQFATVSAATATQLTASVNYASATGPICVTTAGLTGCSSSSFTVPVPTISNVSPATAAVGTTVTITGTNFDPTASNNAVSFNDTYGSVLTASSTQLTIAVPSNSTSGPLCVSVQGGTPACVAFTVGTPAITGFSPSSGPVGTVVTITGANFNPTANKNAVFWEGDGLNGDVEEGAYPSSASATQLVATVPNSSTTGPLCVTVSGYATKACASTNFVVIGPVITSFSPTSGVVGDTITITGSGFSPNGSGNIVKFGGIASSDVVSASATQLVVKVPKYAQPGVICVIYGTQGCSAGSFNVILPTISNFSPTVAPNGSTVTITGTNFSSIPANNSVIFNNEFVAVVTSASATQLTVTTHDDTTTGPICVSVSNSASACTTTNFTVPAVTVTNFAPTSGAVGTQVTISGSNFSPNLNFNDSTINGWSGTNVAESTGQLVTTVPLHATTGPVCVAIGAVSPVCGATNFTIPLASITSLSPNHGPAGTAVTIHGTYFSPVGAYNLATFNGTQAEVFSSSATQMNVTVPHGATTGPVAVSVGGVAGSSTATFTITAFIEGFAPTQGSTGTTVTIAGDGFDPVASNNVVTLGGTTVPVSSASASQLVFIVPSGASSGSISVSVDGQAPQLSSALFEVLPTISGFIPTSGPVNTTVTINGTGFSTSLAGNSVAFNGLPATVTAATSTSLQISVPSGAQSGPIFVSVEGASATSEDSFTVTGGSLGPVTVYGYDAKGRLTQVGSANGSRQYVYDALGNLVSVSTIPANQLAVFSVAPGEGMGGDSITINGQGFSTTLNSNVVKFNGSTATLLSSSTTQIVAVVPSGATSGTVSVTVGANTTASTTSFIVNP